MTTIADFVALAKKQLGVPYVFGGVTLAGTPSPGLDCSGLIYACCLALGESVPRTSEAQWSGLPHVTEGELRPGDIILFDVPSDDQAQPAHVAIYLSPGQMLQAPHTGADVELSPFADSMSWGSVMGYARLPFPDAPVFVAPTEPTKEEMMNCAIGADGTIVVAGVGTDPANATHPLVFTKAPGQPWSVDDLTDDIEAKFPGQVYTIS